MNSLIAVIITSLFYVLTGWYMTYLFPIKFTIERVGLSFLIGAGLTTFLWFVGYLIGLPFNLYTLAIIGAIEILIGNYFSRKTPSINLENVVLKKKKIDLILIIIIITILLLSFIISSYNALTAWDSLALYDFRAHAIAINHNLRDITDSSYYVSYPLMISLVHATVYMLNGLNAQGIHSIILMAFTAIIYGRMRDWTNHTIALSTCLLIITQNQIFYHSTFAYTNLPYTAFLVSGFAYAVSAVKNKYNYLLLGGLLIGLSTWVRSSETFWVIGILLILAQGFVIKKKLYAVFAALLIIVIRFTWTMYLNAVLVSINYVYDQTLSAFGISNISKITKNLPALFEYIKSNVIYPYSGVWFLSIPISIIVFIKKDIKLMLLLAAIIMSAGMVVVGIMVFSTYYVTWYDIGDSARRMTMFVIPLSIMSAMYALTLLTKKSKNV